MKDPKKKRARDEWGSRAHTVFDRPAVAADAQPQERPPVSKEVEDLAYNEWMKWANAAVDHRAAIDLPKDFVIEKPKRGEWITWAQIVVDRLTTVTHIYGKPPYRDVFMPEKERQAKNGKTLDLLRRIHTLTDEADTPTDSLTDLEHHDERVMAGLNVLLREALDLLPELSADMQLLLKSPWYNNCNGRLAEELFRGPLGHEPEGIGSGYPEHGRLPQVLDQLLEREKAGNGRQQREALHPHAQIPRRDAEAHRRWVEQNSQLYRSAGRVE
jgi:hypothetical protein